MTIDTAEVHPTFLVEDVQGKLLGDSLIPIGGSQIEFEGRVHDIGQIGFCEEGDLTHLALTVRDGLSEMVKAPLPAWAVGANESLIIC